MVMGPRQHSARTESSSASAALAQLKDEVSRLSTMTDALSAELPSLAQIVVTTQSDLKKKVLASLKECEVQITREYDALKILTEKLPKSAAVPFHSRQRILNQLKSGVLDKSVRAEDLFFRGREMPPEVPVLSHKQTLDLLTSIAVYRGAFWRRLYDIPAIQNHALAVLESARQPERSPSLILHSAVLGKPDEQHLRDKISTVLRDVADMSRTRRGAVSLEVRKTIAEKLSEIPLTAHDLNEQFVELLAKLNQFVDSEIALVSTYGKTNNARAKEDPRYQTWLALSREFGSGALRARECVSELVKLQEPYLRLRNYVATANNFFVHKVVKDRARYLPYRDDVIQEGNLGLMRAIEKFDVGSGRHFLTYAGYWIAQTAARGWERISQQIVIPSRLHVTVSKLRHEVGDHQRIDPSMFAEKFQENEEHVAALIPLVRSFVSLNGTAPGTTSPRDRLLEDPRENDAPEKLDAEVRRGIVRKTLEILNEDEIAVIVGRFGLDGSSPLTLEDLARKLNLTKERIRQIQNKALNELGAGLTGKTLKQLADDLKN